MLPQESPLIPLLPQSIVGDKLTVFIQRILCRMGEREREKKDTTL